MKKENIDKKKESKEQETETTQTEQVKDSAPKEEEIQAPDVAKEANEYNELLERYNNLNDAHLRLMADFDNYRKRTIREKGDLIKNAGERIIIDFLPIIDNFERAIESMGQTDDLNAVKEGVVLIYQQMLKMMQQNGVKVIETENLPLDTEFHEAITTIPAPSPEMKDKIIDCTTKGYTMNDKVIRHAKVVVAQ